MSTPITTHDNDPITNPAVEDWLLRDGAPVRVRVKKGLSDGEFIELTSDEVQEGGLTIVEVLEGQTS